MTINDKKRILKDLRMRWEMTKSACNECIADELIEFGNEIEKDLEIAELLKDKLYWFSYVYKNASVEDLIQLVFLYVDAFKLIEKHFDIKCFNHSNYTSCTLEIYKGDERRATAELFDGDQHTFPVLWDLRRKLENGK